MTANIYSFISMTDPGKTRRQRQQGTSASQSEAREAAERQNEERQRDRSSRGRQFLFIDATADRSTSSEAVRVHVMREAHRTRRERQGSQSHSRSRRAAAQDEMIFLDTRTTNTPVSVTPPTISATEETSNAPASISTIEWPSIIRAGVSRSSLESTEELHQLAEGYIRSVRMVQPDVLHICKGDLLSMNAYLALASLQLASNEQDPANVASVQFEARALELLRQRITPSTSRHIDSTIIAVLLLSKLERHKDNAESALFHQNALQRLVQDRGGLAGVRERNVELHNILVESGLLGDA